VSAGAPVVASAALTGPGIAPEARAASGTFAAIGADNRIPVLAPLVGTFYEAPSPGAKPFVEVGSTVGAGDTVCIVEAMKLMNEVAASDGGKVAEIVVTNGERVEFEQVLMYLEPLED
jgi:acetyl-CoA carboxylase biotin carboxyl carrier protein